MADKYLHCDWRQVLQKNQRKTTWVMVIFVIIYLLLGFILDIFAHGGFSPAHFVNGVFVPNQFSVICANLLTFKIVPVITIVMAVVAIISLLITYTIYDRIMLLGTEYHQVKQDNTKTLEEKQLYIVVDELRIAAGMRYMPKIYIIDADYMNAFASGYSGRARPRRLANRPLAGRASRAGWLSWVPSYSSILFPRPL